MYFYFVFCLNNLSKQCKGGVDVKTFTEKFVSKEHIIINYDKRKNHFSSPFGEKIVAIFSQSASNDEYQKNSAAIPI